MNVPALTDRRSAVILLFQRMSTIPREIDPSADPVSVYISTSLGPFSSVNGYLQWQYATNRCIYACDNMVFKVRQMTDDELSVSNPHLVFCFFTVARFYIGKFIPHGARQRS